MSSRDQTNKRTTSRGVKAGRSSLGLVVLWQLFDGPKHAYGIQKLLQQQGKDRVVNVRARASLYQTVERLMRLGLVEVHETARREGYPDRILYGITDAGREAAREWLREMLRTTSGEFPEFITAVSILFGLTPEDARAQLEERAARLSVELAETDAQLEGNPGLPRLFLLEEEYRRVVQQAELSWVRGVISDLEAKRLTWSEQWLQEVFTAFHPQGSNEDEAI